LPGVVPEQGLVLVLVVEVAEAFFKDMLGFSREVLIM
jgi:hypothetical protein